MEKQKIHFGYFGNGVSFWTECGIKPVPDFTAHIDTDRTIVFNQKDAPQYFVEAVERMAKCGNLIFGNSEDTRFLVLDPLNKPTKYCDTKFYGRYLFSEEIVDGEKFTCHGRSIVNWKNLRDYDPDKNDAVYFVIGRRGKGAYIRLGYSFREKIAESTLADYKRLAGDIDFEFQVERHDEKFLLQCGEKAGVNLDFED